MRFELNRIEFRIRQEAKKRRNKNNWELASCKNIFEYISEELIVQSHKYALGNITIEIEIRNLVYNNDVLHVWKGKQS